MSTYTQILYQIVFSTKGRERTLHKINREKLYHFIWGILKNNNCFLYRIGGTDDHLHIVFSLHPTKALSNLVKDIKLATVVYIKEENLFPHFSGWQEGYGAFTYSINEKDNLIEYVKSQEEHHKDVNSYEEYKIYLNELKIEYQEKYVE